MQFDDYMEIWILFLCHPRGHCLLNGVKKIHGLLFFVSF